MIVTIVRCLVEQSSNFTQSSSMSRADVSMHAMVPTAIFRKTTRESVRRAELSALELGCLWRGRDLNSLFNWCSRCCLDVVILDLLGQRLLSLPCPDGMQLCEAQMYHAAHKYDP